MSSWNDPKYSRDAEMGTGGQWPELDDDLYDAIIQDISEPVEEPNKFKAKDSDPDLVTRFYITWELTSGDVPENTTLRDYIGLPQTYLDEGYVNEKSKLYEVMTALGLVLPCRVDPPSWQGMKARVMVECPRDKDGTQTGWPKITGRKPSRPVGRQTAAARR